MKPLETLAAALEFQVAVTKAPPNDSFAALMLDHLPAIGVDIESYIHGLTELHDLIDARRLLMSFGRSVEWIESTIYSTLHSRK